MDKASETAKAAKEEAYGAKDRASEKGDEVMDRAHEDKEKTGGFIKEKTEGAKEKASEAAQYARDTAEAGKEKTGNLLQQVHIRKDIYYYISSVDDIYGTILLIVFILGIYKSRTVEYWKTGEQVKSTAQGAADAVKHALGMDTDNYNPAAKEDETNEY